MSGIRSKVGFGEGSWFEENVRRVVGGGSSTYFWLDNWVGAHLYVCVFLACMTWLKIRG